MRLTCLASLALIASCSASLEADVDVFTNMSEDRVAEITSDGFDACTLLSPEETWVFWDTVLSEADQRTVRSTSHKDLIQFHFGWGTGIRNGMCLWKGGPLQTWFTDRDVMHPDNMSGLLIDLYWAHLNDCHPDMDAYARSEYPGDPALLNCPTTVKWGADDEETNSQDVISED